MEHITFTPTGVCSRQIDFDLDEEGRVRNVRFTAGCHGNQQGIGALTEGMTAAEVVSRLRGIDCRGRGTSCPDQLACAIEQAVNGGRSC